MFTPLPVWRTHNYFGPGQSDYNTQPIDSDDSIARKHDLLYEAAQNKSDVFKADREAVQEFAQDIFENWNWHSIVGAAGLGIKHVIESSFDHVFYPSLQRDSETQDGRSVAINDPLPKAIFGGPTASINDASQPNNVSVLRRPPRKRVTTTKAVPKTTKKPKTYDRPPSVPETTSRKQDLQRPSIIRNSIGPYAVGSYRTKKRRAKTTL